MELKLFARLLNSNRGNTQVGTQKQEVPRPFEKEERQLVKQKREEHTRNKLDKVKRRVFSLPLCKRSRETYLIQTWRESLPLHRPVNKSLQGRSALRRKTS